MTFTDIFQCSHPLFQHPLQHIMAEHLIGKRSIANTLTCNHFAVIYKSKAESLFTSLPPFIIIEYLRIYRVFFTHSENNFNITVPENSKLNTEMSSFILSSFEILSLSSFLRSISPSIYYPHHFTISPFAYHVH